MTRLLTSRNGVRAAGIVAAIALHGAASAQSIAPAKAPTTLTLNVEGRATRTPDIAEVSGGVVTSAPTAAAAMAENVSLAAPLRQSKCLLLRYFHVNR